MAWATLSALLRSPEAVFGCAPSLHRLPCGSVPSAFMTVWQEIGERVFVRRYTFYDQNIGVVLGDDGCLVIDTRSSHRQAEEIRTDLLALTALPVAVVVNTHGHFDHAFGNSVFRPVPIVAHEGCVRFLRETAEESRRWLMREQPELAAEVAEVEIDVPDRTFTDCEVINVGGRPVELRYLGRGHTDHDIVVVVPDGGVLFAGDLLENGAPPAFGDAWPMDWPATVEALVALAGESAVAPGHGDVADRQFAVGQLEGLRAVAALATEVHRGERSLEDALRAPDIFGPHDLREPLERALAQLRGELD